MSEDVFDRLSRDFRSAADVANALLIGCEPMNSVVFYAGAKTLTILCDDVVPDFLSWFGERLSAGEWRPAEGSVTTGGRYYDKAEGKGRIG